MGWAASGEGVLRHTLTRVKRKVDGPKDDWLYRRYAGPSGISMFFRDEGLSDLIGFTYANWHADDAVNNLVHQLEQIGARGGNHLAHGVGLAALAWEEKRSGHGLHH